MATVHQLLGVLRSKGVSSGAELTAALGIRRSRLSELVQSAADAVCRMGGTRAARYAATRELEDLGTTLPVYRVSGEGRLEEWGELRTLWGGGHWWTRAGKGEFFEGLPPEVADMAPQGYLGRAFAHRHAEALDLPPRLNAWTDDHRLIALARRGEDFPGNLILGRESADRWLANPVQEVPPEAYPSLAEAVLAGEVGSSAGGEQPKFCVFSRGRHRIVKFVRLQEGPASERWGDLLVCEHLALETLRQHGVLASETSWVDVGTLRCLEVERFDRVAARGRRAVVSLAAIDNEHYGLGSSWTRLSLALRRDGRIAEGDDRSMRWLDVFGQLIADTDRHPGNLAFHVDPTHGHLALAPAYDTLPMNFAPVQTQLVDRPYSPSPPTTDTLDVWPEAAAAAEAFWLRTLNELALSDGFRALSKRCLEALRAARARFGFP